MPAHPEFTTAFDASLRGAPLPFGVTAASPAEVEQRFAVYRNNVAVSLTAALAKRFPVIQRLVGEAFFAAMGRVYSEAHRPKSPALLEWGDSFPEFLDGFPPLSGYRYMADVARIEYARGVAFHAADARSASAESFISASPSQLRLHPSVQVLRLDHPAVSIWRQNQPGATPEKLVLAGAEIALILRGPGFNVPVHAITEGDAVLIDHIRRDASLTVAAELAQWAEPCHDPQPLILRLFQAGAILDPQEDT
ncbi:HvfC/BufC N-terminal domain-containing protein [Pseudotabrizicola alkalilacus]|uniref:HvfC/BufC N-terminal domain-containing protein n=1 Tax=Pseudotabrizicola alkalilacus TaxID=2305252 RepID=UPI0013140B34|nr:DNA-binding domain-containing protein [Pseudotabrizicola alkalilacus]